MTYSFNLHRRAVKETQKPVAISEFEEELHRLATERRNAEERRKQEEEALQRKIEEIEAKKEEEEEKERQVKTRHNVQRGLSLCAV